jgi:hypothetical protein
MQAEPNIEGLLAPNLENIILLLCAKRKMFQDMQDRISTLVVGSSHGDFGFDPRYCENAFNLCSPSQDLKHSFHLYKNTCETVSTLKTLVIFYSVFSPGNFMERSPGEKANCPVLNEAFGLGLQYEDAELSGLASLLKGELDDLSSEFAGLEGHAGFLPVFGKTFFPDSYGAQLRADKHLKLNKNGEANLFLMDMLLLAKAMNHRVCIVIPPVRQDYKQATGGDFNYLFRDLLLILDELKTSNPKLDIQLINGFDDSEFTDDLFGDFDHLLPTEEGVKILSSKVQRAIR